MRWFCYSIAVGCLSATAAAQQAAPPAPPVRCTGEEYRELDYMLGDWRVIHTASGQLMGQNRVEWVNLGCAVRENLVFPGRGEGTSIYFYSPIDRLWHGNYHDSSGLFATFSGAIVNGRHVVETRVRFPQEPQREWRVRQSTFKANTGWPRQIGERWQEGRNEWEPLYDVSFCPTTRRADDAQPCR